MGDWDAVRSVIEEKKVRRRVEKPAETVEAGDVFTLSKTDLAVIKVLLRRGESSLRDLREAINKSRVSIYLSLRRLKKLSLVDGRAHLVELKKNPLVDYISQLFNEKFRLEKLSGERLPVLQSLLDWKSLDQIAVECGISPPSVYRYLQELKPLIRKSGRRYRIREDKENLIEFLRLVKKQTESGSGMVEIWSSPEGRLLKTTDAVDGSLTAFSRFPEFGVDYSPGYLYYYVPRKKLSVEEIFIHSLCAGGDRTFPKIMEFYMKNNGLIDVFVVDELALRFNVVDSWLDLQARIRDTTAKDKDIEGQEPYYLSPENIFLSSSISNTVGDILECEEIMKKEELSWEMLFHEYVLRQMYSDFSWKAIVSRLQILEQRTGIKIPLLKKLFNIYLERAILIAVEKPKTVNELREELTISEYRIRNALSRMTKKRLIRKIDAKPLKFIASKSP
jgi:predicted transcriptional regulator